MTMGLVGSLAWVNAYSRKQSRSLFWRMRAALKKALKNSSGKKQFRFQYDPCSYALNFDDGCWKLGEGAATGIKHARTQQHSGFDINTTAWVYVLWVIPE